MLTPEIFMTVVTSAGKKQVSFPTQVVELCYLVCTYMYVSVLAVNRKGKLRGLEVEVTL